MFTTFRILLVLGLFSYTTSEYSLYECPSGWEDFGEYCYFFIQSSLALSEAKVECEDNGAFLLSINDFEEHNFIINSLEVYDGGQRRRSWWTSGRRVQDTLDFFWEGDGTSVESFFYWLNDTIPTQMDRSIIMYFYDGVNWGWILGFGNETSPAVCKISKDDIYMIKDEIRGPDYGVDDPNPDAVLKGPRFIQQPDDVVHHPPQMINQGSDQTYIECIADANPDATYEWYKTRGGVTTKIDPNTDNRYTFINGRLIIDKPGAERGDDGSYQCVATNQFGSILSDMVSLSFGYLKDFPKSPRSPINAMAYSWTSIECNPPPHFPEILFTWYKDSASNFVRPELKPYLYISNDGRLYFSEVTMDDVGEYVCVVNMPGLTWASGAESMPTALRVSEGSPGIYDPQIGLGFPFVYPVNPHIGNNVRLECWASGTSRPELEYSWDKVELVDESGNKCTESNIRRVLPLPKQARFTDHNRVLVIRDIQLYDGGTYRCTVVRPYGGYDCETTQVLLQAEPYFIVELKDQYVDSGSDLTWRCDASGEDGNGPQVSYTWLKNSLPLADQILPEDSDRVTIKQNTVTFLNLDAKKDNGMYQCSATNLHGTRYSSGELRVLTIAPSFAKYPLQPSQYATKDGNTTIICKPEAAPKAIITWYKNGALLNPGDDEFSRIRQMPNGNLLISPVQTGDTGFFKCHAANDIGEDESSGNLTVLDSVTISLPPLTTTVVVNKTTFLHCMASYHPGLDVTYTWFHQDRLIEFEKVYRLGENRYVIWKDPHWKRGKGMYNGGLYIMRAQYMHTGRYTCLVESPLGDRFERWADVTAVGPPSEVAGVDFDTNSITTISVVVSWKAAGINGAPIKSFIIEAYNFWEGFWRIIYTNIYVTPDVTNTYSYNVTNLRPYSRYQLRMRAENKYGTSIASKPSDEFATLPVKPDLYPEQVGGGGGKVGDLSITWVPLDPWEENGPEFGYRVYWKPTGDEDFDEDQIFMVNENIGKAVILVGQDNWYRTYDIAVQAFNTLDLSTGVKSFGPISPLVVIRSAMGLPTAIGTNVRSQPFNSTACKLTWDPVIDSPEYMKGKLGGYKLGYWRELHGPDYESPWRVTMNGQMSEGLVIGLDPDTQYYFAIYVWNQAGNGPKSQWFLQRTLRDAPINQPVEVKIYIKSENAIQVYWRGVSTNHMEEPLEGYKVRIWREGEEIKVAKDYDSDKRTNLYIDDLKPDILYKLRVFGYSRGGDGTMSSPGLTFMLGSGNHVQISLIIFVLSILISISNVSK